ncbi:MAG: RNA polymerase sigma factor [Pseudomonadales bacterium]
MLHATGSLAVIVAAGLPLSTGLAGSSSDYTQVKKNTATGYGLNSSALNNFLASQERRAYRMAFLATHDRDEALDIVQDAMFKLAKHYAGKSAADWGPFFTRIMQNCIKNWYRSQSLRNRWTAWFGNSEEKTELINSAACDKPDPAGRTQQSRFSAALNEALHTLPRRQQQVFLLRAVEGLDVKQTADAMSCSEGSVKTHYSRAVHRLKDELGDFAT